MHRQLSDYDFSDQLKQNTSVYWAPITLEEIVTVMICQRYPKWLHARNKQAKNWMGQKQNVL